MLAAEHNKTELQELVLCCSCSGLTHVIRFTFDGDFAAIEVALPPTRLLRRIGLAFSYIFGGPCRYLNASEVVLKYEDLCKLKDLIHDYLLSNAYKS